MDIKQAIGNKNATLRNAYNRGDSAGCVAVFLEDAIMLPPGQPMIRGKKAIRELIDGWIDNIGGTISNPMTEFGVEGDLAYQVANYAFQNTKAPDQGKFVEILRRQQDGTWKVYLCIYNSDKPESEAPATVSQQL
jgi:ketosteroid isomerase-like protein